MVLECPVPSFYDSRSVIGDLRESTDLKPKGRVREPEWRLQRPSLFLLPGFLQEATLSHTPIANCIIASLVLVYRPHLHSFHVNTANPALLISGVDAEGLNFDLQVHLEFAFAARYPTKKHILRRIRGYIAGSITISDWAILAHGAGLPDLQEVDRQSVNERWKRNISG